MALMKCDECSHEISTKAATGPNCGAPNVPKADKPKKKTSILVWLILGAILIVVFVPFQDDPPSSSNTDSKELDSLQAQVQEKFKNEREEILSNISSPLEAEKFAEAKNLTTAFAGTNDPQLLKFHAIASMEVKKASDQAETATLLAKVKNIPASKFAANRDVYARLMTLNPENSHYKEKRNYYQTEINKVIEIAENKRIQTEKRQREEQARKEAVRSDRVAKFGEAPIRSGWDGSYHVVERYLEAIANDPDSLEIDNCTKTYFTESGWLVGCDYRGRNGFGGMVRQSNWFLIAHGRVLKMEDASAYNL